MLHQGRDGTICGSKVVIQTTIGMGNAFKHLLYKHFDGSEDVVVKAYNDALAEANAKGGPLTARLSQMRHNQTEGGCHCRLD